MVKIYFCLRVTTYTIICATTVYVMYKLDIKSILKYAYLEYFHFLIQPAGRATALWITGSAKLNIWLQRNHRVTGSFLGCKLRISHFITRSVIAPCPNEQHSGNITLGTKTVIQGFIPQCNTSVSVYFTPFIPLSLPCLFSSMLVKLLKERPDFHSAVCTKTRS